MRRALRPIVDLAEAVVAMVYAGWLVRSRPRGMLVTPAESGTATGPDRRDVLRAARLSVAVTRVSRLLGSRPRCLTRAIALQRLLEWNHLTGSHIRIGVQHASGGLKAHAWVEYGSAILGDLPDNVRSFSPLIGVRVSRPR